MVCSRYFWIYDGNDDGEEKMKKNYIWIILLIISATVVTASYEISNNMNACEDIRTQWLSIWDTKCVGTCVSITNGISDCLKSHTLSNPIAVGESHVFADFTSSCESLTGESKQVYDCMYNGGSSASGFLNMFTNKYFGIPLWTYLIIVVVVLFLFMKKK